MLTASSNGLNGPNLPATLRAQYAHILPRLLLIPEFAAWFDLCAQYLPSSVEPMHHLYFCLCLGAPLCTLLELLGVHASGKLAADSENFVMEDSTPERRTELVASFVQGIRMLEVQNRISFGEVFKVEHLFDRTAIGFAKVLKTIGRVLQSLEATYPGIFVLGDASQVRCNELRRELVQNERIYLSHLMSLAEHSAVLLEGIDPEENLLICLCMNLERLLEYHHQVYAYLEDLLINPHKHNWEDIFSFDVPLMHPTAIAAYKSYCADYHNLVHFLIVEVLDNHPVLASHASKVLDLISEPLEHVSGYAAILQALIEHTMPTDYPHYASLCAAHFKWREIRTSIREISIQIKTMWSINPIKARAFGWRNLNIDHLGSLLHDDRLIMHETTDRVLTRCSLLLFESVLVCCKDNFVEPSSGYTGYHPEETDYPLPPWELGPAIRTNTPLVLVQAIPLRAIEDAHSPHPSSFQVVWRENTAERFMTFICRSEQQLQQWLDVLSPFVPFHPPVRCESPSSLDEDSDPSSILDKSFLDAGIRRASHPRPWSLHARKAPHSESSSLIAQGPPDHAAPLSPTMLPSLFDVRSRKAMSIIALSAEPADDLEPLPSILQVTKLPPTPPPELHSRSSTASWDSDEYNPICDLTGEVTLVGPYAVAHGGFGDVWKGAWKKPGDRESGVQMVAVKILRVSADGDRPDRKIAKRLRRELRIWQKLDHPNVIKLCGVISDLGAHMSFVCPWMDQGCATKFIRNEGSRLRLIDRLRLLFDVAAGLQYLHENSVVHGDLTGSNILIDADRRACLSDFGMSNVMAELQSTSFWTSTIGGAVRWMPPEFYRIPSEDEDELPQLSPGSDIYSFGSVTLEIISGNVPYHYLWNDAQVIIQLSRGIKPRRPPDPFFSDTLWDFMQRCWLDRISDRPSAEVVRERVKGFISLQELKELKK